MHKIAIISLGCPKNLADMEAVLAGLNNVQITNEKDAEIVFLNTCGFLKAARDEVYENLNRLKNKKVILLGCLASKFTENSFKEYKQLQAIISSANYKNIQKIFNKVSSGEKVYAVLKEPTIFEKTLGKSLLTPKSYAYIKIAEGCNNKCSYCLIPYLKGKYRSRKMSDIISEAKDLVKLGVKEIILVAQDCGYYGMDLNGKKQLKPLLEKLSKIKGDFWIRLLYIYPERIDEELLKTIASSEKICKYLDIPLQHGDAEILKNMFRPNNIPKILQKISTIRKMIPGVTLRTSFITGFPGETEKAFKNLLKFIKEIQFDHVGVFEYSREKGTFAYSLKNQIPEKIKSSRRKKAMIIQQKISLNKNKKLIGKTFKTLIEKYDSAKNLYIGRSMRFSPDIDGEIAITSSKKIDLNTFYDIKITGAAEYDLFGEAL